jgi:hypothetical protein
MIGLSPVIVPEREVAAICSCTPGGPACRHKATVEIDLRDVAKLRCKRCGHRDPLIVGRAPMQAWARSRRAAR